MALFRRHLKARQAVGTSSPVSSPRQAAAVPTPPQSPVSDGLTAAIKLRCLEDEDSFETHEGTTVHVHGYSLIWGDRSLDRDEWPKLYPQHVFAFRVAGITHNQQGANSRAFVAGKVILLERERSNPYDRNAIRVMSQDRQHQAGFVPKDVAALIAPLMDAARTSRAAGAVLKTFSVEHHRHGIEVVAAAGRELDLVF